MKGIFNSLHFALSEFDKSEIYFIKGSGEWCFVVTRLGDYSWLNLQCGLNINGRRYHIRNNHISVNEENIAIVMAKMCDDFNLPFPEEMVSQFWRCLTCDTVGCHTVGNEIQCGACGENMSFSQYKDCL